MKIVPEIKVLTVLRNPEEVLTKLVTRRMSDKRKEKEIDHIVRRYIQNMQQLYQASLEILKFENKKLVKNWYTRTEGHWGRLIED